MYDSYGNVTRVTQTLKAGKSRRTDIACDAAYKNAYPTSFKQCVTSSTGTKTLEERYVKLILKTKKNAYEALFCVFRINSFKHSNELLIRHVSAPASDSFINGLHWIWIG